MNKLSTVLNFDLQSITVVNFGCCCLTLLEWSLVNRDATTEANSRKCFLTCMYQARNNVFSINIGHIFSEMLAKVVWGHSIFFSVTKLTNFSLPNKYGTKKKLRKKIRLSTRALKRGMKVEHHCISVNLVTRHCLRKNFDNILFGKIG